MFGSVTLATSVFVASRCFSPLSRSPIYAFSLFNLAYSNQGYFTSHIARNTPSP